MRESTSESIFFLRIGEGRISWCTLLISTLMCWICCISSSAMVLRAGPGSPGKRLIRRLLETGDLGQQLEQWDVAKRSERALSRLCRIKSRSLLVQRGSKEALCRGSRISPGPCVAQRQPVPPERLVYGWMRGRTAVPESFTNSG